MKTYLCVVDGSSTTRNNVVSPSDGNGNQECPVCNVAGFQNQNQLAEHIDSHFNEKKNTVNNFAPIFIPFDYIFNMFKTIHCRGGLAGCPGCKIGHAMFANLVNLLRERKRF